MLWTLIAVYAAARLLQLFPGAPMIAIVALQVLVPAAFALIHGAARYRLRGALVFLGLALAIGNAVENIGVLTGFPFGRYHFTGMMGPKILEVPILLGLAYVGMGYLSWTLACVILRDGAARAWTLPAAAAFIMVGWDLAMDPIWSTVLHAWIWEDGGPYFGVPIRNFLGWYGTDYVIFLAFGLYLRGRPTEAHALGPNYWRQAALLYTVCTAGNLLLVAPAGLSIVTDPSGVQWRIGDIIAASWMVSTFTMGALAAFAWARIDGWEASRAEDGRSETPGATAATTRVGSVS